MKIAIMQPYLFPYIGYWQLIKSVDTFIIYDDVNFIKKSYINRNSLLNHGVIQQFTLELFGASQNKLINEISVGSNAKKILRTIELNYKKANYYQNVFPLLQSILETDEKNLANYLANSLEKISDYLNLNTKFIISSTIEKDNTLKGQEKILEICKILKATKYVNAIGGKKLYDKEIFLSKKIELMFLETTITEYKQFKNEFIEYMSIIDILMHNSQEEINIMLDKYKYI